MDAFAVLADPTRRELVRLLSVEDRRAGDLAADLDMTAPAVSKQLRVLLDAGMVEDRRLKEDARVRVFSLRPESLHAVRAYLDQLQADWAARLRRFQQHAKSRAGTQHRRTP